MDVDQQRFRYHTEVDPKLGFWILDTKWIRVDPKSISDDEIRQSRAGLVTYGSGEVLCQFGVVETIPAGVHFMRGPVYSDEEPGFRRKAGLSHRKSVGSAHEDGFRSDHLK